MSQKFGRRDLQQLEDQVQESWTKLRYDYEEICVELEFVEAALEEKKEEIAGLEDEIRGLRNTISDLENA